MREDLLRRALESQKTTSRKARSRLSSATTSPRAGSPAGSRPGSRVGSRDLSDDEDLASEFSDGGDESTTSIDGILSGADDDLDGNKWQTELQERIKRISDRTRKGASAAGRVEDLAIYVNIVRSRFILDAIKPQIPELYTAFLKYLRPDAGEIEQLLAIEAIAVTTISDAASSEGLGYEACAKPLYDLVLDTDSLRVKETALRAYALVTFLSAADETAEETVMPVLHSAYESDGIDVAAEDSPAVVEAAIQSWALLATLIDDAEHLTTEAMEALVDQLDANDSSVQVAAGEAIALMYEKSFTELEDDEEPSDDEAVFDRGKQVAPLVKRYQPYRRKDQLLDQLEGLSTVSTRSKSKKERKELHSSFADIHRSVEDPRRGPGYSDALDQETGKEYGSRIRLKLGTDRMDVNQWWKLIRLRTMRRWLKGGLSEHYRSNETLRDILMG